MIHLDKTNRTGSGTAHRPNVRVASAQPVVAQPEPILCELEASPAVGHAEFGESINWYGLSGIVCMVLSACLSLYWILSLIKYALIGCVWC